MSFVTTKQYAGSVGTASLPAPGGSENRRSETAIRSMEQEVMNLPAESWLWHWFESRAITPHTACPVASLAAAFSPSCCTPSLQSASSRGGCTAPRSHLRLRGRDQQRAGA